MPTVHLLSSVAGNIRSLVNAIEKCGWEVSWIRSPADIATADKIILPGVGHFGHCLKTLREGDYLEEIRKHVASGKGFFGICVGMQVLFEGSEEAPGLQGLAVVRGGLRRFDGGSGGGKSVPCIGWNGAVVGGKGEGRSFYGLRGRSKYYYVHSYAALYEEGLLEREGWTVATATYGKETYVGAIGRGKVFATQFHPEKSGAAGLRVIKAFLEGREWEDSRREGNLGAMVEGDVHGSQDGLTRRIIACLDVRANDAGDLVVTKGDQYDVREKTAGSGVRNLGKPVEMAKRYYEQGADEVTFLNITSFRDCPIKDLPMLEVLKRTAETVFVPLTIGGGIRGMDDPESGNNVTALEVAKLYFESGADKVSIGSDAVLAAEEFYKNGRKLGGKTGIETISAAYGNQAVVVSVDPKRIFVSEPTDTKHHTIKTTLPSEDGLEYVWYACTIKGGRETRDMDVVELVQAVEAMGAGEILLNAIDRDGSNRGYDLELINMVKGAVKIPVIASSGAGTPAHFSEVFEKTRTNAALGAGMFHRGEFTVAQVKEHLAQEGLLIRPFETF